MPVKPYTLKQAQALVKDAKVRQKRRHDFWRALEFMYRRGEAVGGLDESDVPAVVWEECPGLTLDSINLVLPNMQIIINQAMAHDPAFLVEPYAGGDQAEQEAKYGEQLLRYFWKRANGTDVARSMVQDTANLGNGFAKVGWAFMEKAFERDDDEIVEELLELEQAEARDAELEGRPPRDMSALVDLVDVEGKAVVMDEPFVEYVSPYDIMVPRRASRMSTCRWIAQRMVLPVDEIESNELFDPEAVKALKFVSIHEDIGDLRSGEEDQGIGSGVLDGDEDPFREATVYEFYDMRARRLLVFQEDAERPLMDIELPYSHRHPPFVHMRCLEDGGDRFWSFGYIENVASIQNEYNQYVFEQMSSARRAGTKYVVDKDLWTDEFKKVIESEQSDVVAPLELNGKPLQDVFQAVDRKALSAEVFQAKSDMQQAVHDVLGINDFQAGGTGADRMSATAAAVVDGTATLRGTDLRFQVEDAVANIGLRMLLLIQEFLDETLALRIVGSDGVVQWLSVSKEDLTGEFGVSVTSGSTMAVNPSTRMARALDVIGEIIPSAAAEGYDTHPLWRQALRDYGMDPDRMLRRLTPEEILARQPPTTSTSPTAPPTVPQELMGGPPVPAAIGGDIAL